MTSTASTLALSLCLALCLGQQVALAAGGDDGTARPRTLQRVLALGRAEMLAAPASTADAPDCNGLALGCASCRQTLQCVKINGVYKPLGAPTDCPATAPYCNNGVCQATPTDDCIRPPQPETDFECNGDGYYPDPANCRRYWMCADGNAYRYDCAYTNAIYSHDRAMCVPSNEASCSTAACSQNMVGAYQRYSPAPEVFFVCRDTTPANALVAACPDSYTVDAATGNCVLTCLDEGRLAVRNDRSRYYECSRIGNNVYSPPIPAACPTGSVFDVTQQRCLSGNEDRTTDDAAPGYYEDYYAENASIPESVYNVPARMLIGAASAAYQIEGAWNYADKSPSIQDVFFHSRPEDENADDAAKSFFKYREDIDALKELKMDFYRLSLAWSRLLPNGSSDAPSATGLQHYNDVIDALVAAGIRPVVTLYHWDLPERYQDDGGWLNAAVQDRFVDYATYCFRNFGDRVKTWVLFNEPSAHCLAGYEVGLLAPGVTEMGTGGYLCLHNMVLAHAKAYRAYDKLFRRDQGGQLGSAADMAFAEPKTARRADRDAAQRYAVWQYAWFYDPLFSGDYPAEMRRVVDARSEREGRRTSRLPRFTDAERAQLKGAWDFFGLNNYRADLVEAPAANATFPASYLGDLAVVTSSDPTWAQTARPSSPVTPWSLAGSVRWIRDRYGNPAVWVLENGYGGPRAETTTDPKRISFHSGYMRGLMRAVNVEGCNVVGYTVWSLIDSFEWNSGYTYKFGLVHVDYSDPERARAVKDSGRFLQLIMATRRVPYVPVT